MVARPSAQACRKVVQIEKVTSWPKFETLLPDFRHVEPTETQASRSLFMDHRLYFILGDLLVNIVVGAIVAAVSWLLISTAWNMYLAMIIMMLLGMIVGTIASFPFVYLYGAMEVMLPGMSTGMMSGMVTGMWLAMDSLSFPFALVVGGFTGFVTIVAVWILNNQIDGVQGKRADG